MVLKHKIWHIFKKRPVVYSQVVVIREKGPPTGFSVKQPLVIDGFMG